MNVIIFREYWLTATHKQSFINIMSYSTSKHMYIDLLNGIHGILSIVHGDISRKQ